MAQNSVSQLVESRAHNRIHIRVRKKVKLRLTVNYTDSYPDTLPQLGLEVVDGELNESESRALLKGLLDVVCRGFRSKDRMLEYAAGRRERGHGDDVHAGFASQGKTVRFGGKSCKGTRSRGARKGASGN